MNIIVGGLVILVSLHLQAVYSQFMPLGNFIKHQNEALSGHVIKTIEANRMDCSMACADLFGCRSVNVYKDSNGKEMCELNNSSKSADPESMESRTGCEHIELTARQGCSTEKCLGPYHWKEFNSSEFRLFEDRVTWEEARKRCHGQGGDLVSIHSKQEQEFISTELLNKAPRGNTTNTKLIMLWKLDGAADVALGLHGAASYKDVDGYKALYLDGNSQNYVTTQPIDLKYRGFTIGAWVKLLTPASEGLVYGDWSPPFQFALKIDKEGKVHFKLMFHSTNTTTLTTTRSITSNVWTHVMASWSRNERLKLIYIDGSKEAKEYLNIENENLMSTNHRYDIGLERNSSEALHAYIRELAVFAWPSISVSLAEKRIGRWDKRDAVWTGLNDISLENKFTFSDGTPLSYQHWKDGFPRDTYKFSDCVALAMETAPNYTWVDDSCGLELPYICRRKIID